MNAEKYLNLLKSVHNEIRRKFKGYRLFQDDNAPYIEHQLLKNGREKKIIPHNHGLHKAQT